VIEASVLDDGLRLPVQLRRPSSAFRGRICPPDSSDPPPCCRSTSRPGPSTACRGAARRGNSRSNPHSGATAASFNAFLPAWRDPQPRLHRRLAPALRPQRFSTLGHASKNPLRYVGGIAAVGLTVSGAALAAEGLAGVALGITEFISGTAATGEAVALTTETTTTIAETVYGLAVMGTDICPL